MRPTRCVGRAELEHRSMQEVARQAIREYVENHSRAEPSQSTGA